MKWLFVPRANPGAKTRVFCFHFAGGSAQSFRNLGLKLDSDFELNAIQLPGHAERIKEAPYTRMPEIIENLVPSIREYFDRPYVLLGQSLGGLTAFETARKLRELNSRAPELLIVASRPAPQFIAPATSYDRSDEEFLDIMENRYGALPGREILEDPDMRRLLLPVLKTDMEVYETYRYTGCAPFDFPIVSLKGADDPKLPEDQISEWRGLTTKNFRSLQLPGGHFFWQNNEAAFIAEVNRLLNEYANAR